MALVNILFQEKRFNVMDHVWFVQKAQVKCTLELVNLRTKLSLSIISKTHELIQCQIIDFNKLNIFISLFIWPNQSECPPNSSLLERVEHSFSCWNAAIFHLSICNCCMNCQKFNYDTNPFYGKVKFSQYLGSKY